MPSHWKFCTCNQCKYALRTRPVSQLMTVLTRRFRRKAKAAIKEGREPEKKESAPRCG